MAIYRASYSQGQLTGPQFEAECVFGKAGVIAAEAKREGDQASPIGAWPVRRALFRADRIEQPQTALVIDPIDAQDGWCDAPDDPAYNRPVRLPYPASHEVMTRKDGLYDLVVVLGHNDDPPLAPMGSAIFLHCRPDHDRGTLGCLALERDALISLLAQLQPGDVIEIAP